MQIKVVTWPSVSPSPEALHGHHVKSCCHGSWIYPHSSSLPGFPLWHFSTSVAFLATFCVPSRQWKHHRGRDEYFLLTAASPGPGTGPSRRPVKNRPVNELRAQTHRRNKADLTPYPGPAAPRARRACVGRGKGRRGNSVRCTAHHSLNPQTHTVKPAPRCGRGLGACASEQRRWPALRGSGPRRGGVQRSSVPMLVLGCTDRDGFPRSLTLTFFLFLFFFF